jgi:DNA-binding NtrC family response regulator
MQAKQGLLEAAAGGTVLLDEIGEMSPDLQSKLLRAIDSGEVTRVGSVRPISIDVRFLAATHRDLHGAIATGEFRRDLYYRLAGMTLEIPALRDRPNRVAALAATFVAALATKQSRPITLSPPALARLQSHRWPGNVRELKHAIERAVLLAPAQADGSLTLAPEHILLDVPADAASTPPAAQSGDAPWNEPERAERDRIIAALEAAAGNQTVAARALGISRATLVNRLSLYRLPRPRKTR